MQNINYNKCVLFNLIMNNFSLKNKIIIIIKLFVHFKIFYGLFKCTKTHLYETKCQDIYMSLYMLTANNIYSFSL